MRNHDVTWFFCLVISTGLRTDPDGAQEHLRSDALPDTTVTRQELIARPMPYPFFHLSLQLFNCGYDICHHPYICQVLLLSLTKRQPLLLLASTSSQSLLGE